jgi:hypothetical protein
LGPSTDTKDGHKVLWKKNGAVSVERNVVYPSSSPIEGEMVNVGLLSTEDASGIESQSQNGSNTSANAPVDTQSIPKSTTSSNTRQPVIQATPTPSITVQAPNPAPPVAPVAQNDVVDFIQGIESEGEEDRVEVEGPRRSGRQRPQWQEGIRVYCHDSRH